MEESNEESGNNFWWLTPVVNGENSELKTSLPLLDGKGKGSWTRRIFENETATSQYLENEMFDTQRKVDGIFHKHWSTTVGGASMYPETGKKKFSKTNQESQITFQACYAGSPTIWNPWPKNLQQNAEAYTLHVVLLLKGDCSSTGN